MSSRRVSSVLSRAAARSDRRLAPHLRERRIGIAPELRRVDAENAAPWTWAKRAMPAAAAGSPFAQPPVNSPPFPRVVENPELFRWSAPCARTLTVAAAVTALAGCLARRRRAGQRPERKGRARRLAAGQARRPAPAHRPGPARHRQGRNRNFSENAPMPQGAKPKVPPGFSVEMVASGLKAPRVIRSRAERRPVRRREGDQHGARPARPAGQREADAERGVRGRPLSALRHRVLSGRTPNPEWIYIANSDGVVRFPYKIGDLKATGAPETDRSSASRGRITGRATSCSRPTASGSCSRSAPARTSRSTCSPTPLEKGGLEAWKKNKPLGAAWDTEERRATVLAFDPDGKNEKIFATGLRNCSGITIQPATGRAVVRGQRARRARRQHAVRICHRGEGRRVLRLALVLHRRQRGPAPEGHAART